MSLKCSGLRERKAGVVPCGRIAKPDLHDAFCSDAHQKDALLYVGQAPYEHHLREFDRVRSSGNASLIKAFNAGPRCMFVSMQEAQKRKVEAHYMTTVCAEYAQGVRTAWSGVGDASGSAEAVAQDMLAVHEQKQVLAKRKSFSDVCAVLFGSGQQSKGKWLLESGTNPSSRASSFSSKKSRTSSVADEIGLLGYAVSEPELEPRVISVEEAAQIPLPADEEWDMDMD
jgi:hypothetical protein